MQSRHGKNLTPYFPDIAAALAAAPAGTVLDGELVIYDPAAGRTSFPALQARVTAGRRLPAEARARPATLVTFDLLHHAGGSLLDEPLAARRAHLEELLLNAPAAVIVCPQTTDVAVARQWFTDYAPTGIEGLVVKDLAGRYRTGRGATWWKYKRRTTAEAIVGGITGTPTNPTTLLLGRRDTRGRLRYVGRTGPLTTAQRAETAHAITVAGGRHPWPQPLPAAWSGQLDQRQPTPYVRVKPLVVAEIVVDHAYEHGRWRHPARHVRLRADLTLTDVQSWSTHAG